MFQKSYLALILLAVLILGISQIVLFRNLQTILGDVDVGQDVAGSRNFAGGHSAQIPSTKDHRSIFPFAIILQCPHMSDIVFVLADDTTLEGSHILLGVRDVRWSAMCTALLSCHYNIARLLYRRNGSVVESPSMIGTCNATISRPPLWIEVDVSPPGSSDKTHKQAVLVMTLFRYPMSSVIFAAQQPHVRGVLQQQHRLASTLDEIVFQRSHHTLVLPDFVLAPCNFRVDGIDAVADFPVWDGKTQAMQITTFIPCTQAAVEFRQALQTGQNHDRPGTPLSSFEKDVLDILRTATDAFDSVGVRFWLNSGTLLGWLRECGVIEHSKDADIGVFADDFADDSEVHALIAVLQGLGLRLSHRFGTLRDSFELSFQALKTGLKLDVFFFYAHNRTPATTLIDDGDRSLLARTQGWWNGGTQARTGLKFRYSFPAITLCWANLLRQLDVRIPCDTEAWVAANYGPTWRTPVSTWDWKKSPPNVAPNGAWPQSTWSQTIQCDVCVYKVNSSSRFDVQFPKTH